MAVPGEVYKLVERFDCNLAAYKRGELNEETVKNEFINPLFVHLGWDMYNERGNPGTHRDVIYEDNVKVGGGTKAPDYGFYVGGARKFFLEAKKPSVKVWSDPHPAFQLRRYAWSAKLPFGLLTDFEELAIYDCYLEPNKADRASTARLSFYTYNQYVEEKQWDEIYSLFSREAVLDGSLDKSTEPTGRKRGVQTIDNMFLKEIENWREALAFDLASLNDLDQYELNYAVQMTIDRLIFLRMAEDRGIEDYKRLLSVTNSLRVYDRLCELFREAEERYNSSLFHFQKKDKSADRFTLGLKISHEVLTDIIKGLYYPESPYEFSVLPIDVLGQVYERFLGKVIRLENGHKAVVEEKPEVRKAGGVYYTPTYIVDYIVEHTVGKLLEKKTPRQASKLKIVDPACGSGSFLIGAYQYLLDWHRNYYIEDGPEKYPNKLHQGPGGQWLLTIGEKKNILLNNIYGIDIDPQAVEVTKLSLLLKVLEGESQESIDTRLRLFHERALPDIDNNIKCGNSLISSDFYDDEQMMLLDEEEHRRINVFDWESNFPQVFTVNDPGFNTVIGNPPYGIVFDEYTKPYLEHRYASFVRNNDNYAAFSQRAVELLAANGMFGFIVPNTFLIGPFFNTLKQTILDATYVERIVDFGLHQVFTEPNVFTAILLLRRRAQPEDYDENDTEFVKVESLHKFAQSDSCRVVNRSSLDSLLWTPENPLVVKSFQKASALDELAWVKDVGLNYWTKGRGKTRGGSIADRVLYEGEAQHPQDKPYLKGRDISRYTAKSAKHWLRHDYRNQLDPTVDTFRYSPEFLEREKIVYRQTADRIIATLELNRLLTDKTLHTIVIRDERREELDPLYLLGLLNSRFLTYLYQVLAQEEGRTFAQVKIFRMKQLPIRLIDPYDPDDEVRHDRIVKLVERMLALHDQLATARTSLEKERVQRQIDYIDNQIDQLVYELYGLTEEEFELVEGG